MARGKEYPGSITYRLLSLFLETEYDGKDVTYTKRQLAQLLGVEDERNGALARALWRMRDRGLVRVVSSRSGWYPSLWVVPANIGERYERWRDGDPFEPEPIEHLLMPDRDQARARYRQLWEQKRKRPRRET